MSLIEYAAAVLSTHAHRMPAFTKLPKARASAMPYPLDVCRRPSQPAALQLLYFGMNVEVRGRGCKVR